MNAPMPQSPGVIQRIIDRALAVTLATFVVPDSETARRAGLDLNEAGLAIAATPRHASVLLVIGDLPDGLARAATVALVQMPRPRTLLALGASTQGTLPTPDVTAPATQDGLIDAVRRIRERGERGSSTITDAMLGIDNTNENEHPEHQMEHLDHGDMEPEGGDTDSGHKHAEGSSNHGDLNEDTSDDREPGDNQHNSMDDDHEMKHDGGTDHAGHDMGGGFMSMIMMTKDMPRSRDGLAMEWVTTSFGPLFPGLPGGLEPTLTLDGDVVADITFSPEVMNRDLAASLRGPLMSVPDRLARIDPSAPVAWRMLGTDAILNLSRNEPIERERRGWIGARELERATSHLGWLSRFLGLLGVDALAERAARLHLALVRTSGIDDIGHMRTQAEHLVRDIRRTPMLGRRLDDIGTLAAAKTVHASGVVARSSGMIRDTRTKESAYREVGFPPLIRTEGDARARLELRLDEIAQSLELVHNAGTINMEEIRVPDNLTGTTTAAIETPHGTATMHVSVHQGIVDGISIATPSVAHAGLVPELANRTEVADALVTIASLDLSPWEMSS